MRLRFTRLTGLGVGLILGAAWMLFAAVVVTPGFTIPTLLGNLSKLYAGLAVPALLSLFGWASGSLSEEAQEQARRAEHRALELEMLLNQVGEAILVIDTETRVRHVTPSYVQSLGFKVEDVVGKKLAELVGDCNLARPDGSTFPLYQAPILRALRGEEVTTEPMVAECAGQRFELLTDAHPIRDKATGKVILAISSSRNVTDLRQLDRLKDEFIATASHELRTPVTLIRALAQLSLLDAGGRQEEEETEAVANLQGIIDQTDRVTRLLNQMLDTSRIDTGKLVLRQQEVQLTALLEQEADRWRITHPSHTFLLDLAHAPGPQRTVIADPEKILEVLANLVANAVKYSPPGSPVTVGVRDVKGSVEVWVKDEGMGVPPGDREAIFAKFYRSPNAVNCDRSGLGLGLYISRRLIELHGGRIWLDPHPGRGSTFRFTLPSSTV